MGKHKKRMCRTCEQEHEPPTGRGCRREVIQPVETSSEEEGDNMAVQREVSRREVHVEVHRRKDPTRLEKVEGAVATIEDKLSAILSRLDSLPSAGPAQPCQETSGSMGRMPENNMAASNLREVARSDISCRTLLGLQETTETGRKFRSKL